MASSLKILTLDIECSPNVAHLWSLWGEQHVSLDQLVSSTEMLCWAAKFTDAKTMHFASVHHDGREIMVRKIHALLSEADAVVTYNGGRYDLPHLSREFVAIGLDPPAPSKSIDLFKVVKRRFKFPSNKLDYVAQELGAGSKAKHEGHTLWVKCMAGDPKAWERMKRYNVRDVRITEALYLKLLPWIPNHPSVAAYTASKVCPACGSARLASNGTRIAATGTYHRYQCRDCGKWSRGTAVISRTTIVQDSDG